MKNVLFAVIAAVAIVILAGCVPERREPIKVAR